MTEPTRGRVTADEDGRSVVTAEDGERAPVVGELSAETTPEDFRRFEKLARQWHLSACETAQAGARRQRNGHN